ncbi:MAG: TolC family protein [Candidatus Solibacter usitatus]|nr:TolC family protein [Candidatus Solibacter usitatus]
MGVLTYALLSPLYAQWTIDEVVRRAGQKYAGVEVSLEQAASAAAAVQLARTAYLPRGDFYAQVNRATRNNVFGMTLPNPVIPSISGPPLAANAGTNVWGSSTGFLVQWEPFDLGQRAATVGTADAARRRAGRAFACTRFEVETAAADAFLTTLAADETVASARAAVERAAALQKLIAAQTEAGLKPGADLARAKAEAAVTEAQLIQAEQAARLARIAVAQLAGGSWQDVKLAAAFARRPDAPIPAAALSHPALSEQQAAVREAEARQHEAAIAWRPRFNTQTALYARGAGANADGSTGGAASGLGPNIYNWGIGFSVLFPFLDLPAIRAKQIAAHHQALAESARLRKLETDLNANLERANAALDAALRIARLVPVQLESARAAFDQARARYQAGLAAISEVADAQRLLAQAEADASIAHLNIWRGRLAVAAAAGDLAPFLERAAR